MHSVAERGMETPYNVMDVQHLDTSGEVAQVGKDAKGKATREWQEVKKVEEKEDSEDGLR